MTEHADTRPAPTSEPHQEEIPMTVPMPMPTDEQVGRSIKAAREARGLKQVDLGRLLTDRGMKVHSSLLSQTEAGTRRLYFTEALLIADALDIDLSALPDWERIAAEKEVAELRERLAAVEARLAATRNRP